MGCQTQDSEKQKDSLQDMVSAFLLQNKFLNKEVNRFILYRKARVRCNNGN